ncbi:MAG: hypothetical protein IPL46_11760 [Saprospiraceae bacterium]|nr:hypothetical protein [Saprospiraceae bacterium]
MERRKLLSYLGLSGALPLSAVIASEANKKQGNQIIHCANISELKSADLSQGDLVKTMGYHVADDGGGATYRIESSAMVDSKQIDAVTHILLSNGLVAVLLKPKVVNYQMFGARGDGIADDGKAIFTAHAYANRNNLPVHNLSGEYWIKDTRGIEIETSVSWGNTVFHIDEKFNTSVSVFHIKSKADGQEIFTDKTERSTLLEEIRPGAQIIPALAPYVNQLLHFKDDIDRIGFRAGERYNSTGRPKEELLYIELEGKVLGDIAWPFKPTVVITAYPTEMSYLTLDGGTFLLSGDDPAVQDSLYSQCGILVSRSRTKIMNQWVGLETSGDQTMRPRSGFYYFQLAYDVELDNVRLVPREKDRVGVDRDVPEGTYGIGGNRVLNLRLKNMTAEGTAIHWG